MILTRNCALANELNHGHTLSCSRSTENLGRKHLEGGFWGEIGSMKLSKASKILLAKLCSFVVPLRCCCYPGESLEVALFKDVIRAR